LSNEKKYNNGRRMDGWISPKKISISSYKK